MCALTTQVFDTDNEIERPHEPGDEVMHLTISLDESLADQLRRRASAKDLSPEQAARELLGHALHRIAEEEAWHESSQRRAELIQKSRSLGLTAEESCELDRLQAATDQRLEAMDRRLLGVAEEFRQLAERLPDATEP
jgi:plasmid stability protein